jgi:CheY-like chemotaxis protein
MAQPMDDDLDVLFIEDDPAVAGMYKLKLELDGYRVRVAESGEDGLALAHTLVPDIVFLDIRLPKMDGFAVLENLRADEVTRNLPVVILSNYGERELVDRGLKLGALDYLIKSETTPSRLTRSIADWVKEPVAE